MPRSALKEFVVSILFLREVARKLYNVFFASKIDQIPFPGSQTYWEDRYLRGGNSGVGSYAKFAEFKAEVVNSFVEENRIDSIVEFGCGDGNQLTLANYNHYIGFDVSRTAVAHCRELFASDYTKSFFMLDEYAGQTADLTLSLDVVYHLVEDNIFEEYMRRLFDSATRFVIIYSSDTNENTGFEDAHVRHRKFSEWIEKNVRGWSLKQHIPNRHPYNGDYTQTSFADFYIYGRTY